MSIHAQNLIALARQEFRSFEGAAERALIRAKGKCLREHCAQQHARLDATICLSPRMVSAVLAEMLPPKKKILFPEKLSTPKAQSKNILFHDLKPPAPAPSKMPALTPEQKQTFKF